MSLLKIWKILVALVAIFGSGAYTGHVLTVGALRDKGERRASVDAYTHHTIEKLRAELDLKPAQKATIEEHVLEAGKQLKREYHGVLSRILGILEEASVNIRAELDPEQEKKFDELMRQTRARIRARMQS